MAERILGATQPNVTTCVHEQQAVFDTDAYADSPVYGATCVGGSIEFSRFRGIKSSYYFIIYINGVKACETVEINDQSQSTHSMTTYIDTAYSINSTALLQSSGTIKVEVIDNGNKSGQVCSFRDDCDITIRASYYTPTMSITSFTVSQDNYGQYAASWSASAQYGSGSVQYSLYYGSSDELVYSGTATSAKITIPSSYYGVSVPFRLEATYSGIYDEADASCTAKKPSVSKPTNLKIDGGSSYRGITAPLTWNASSLSFTTGTITYGILFNGQQVATTTGTSFEVSEDIAKQYSPGSISVTIKATCGSYSSVSSSVTFVYDTGSNYLMYYANGSFVACIPYIYINGTWKECVPYYRTSDEWKECSC